MSNAITLIFICVFCQSFAAKTGVEAKVASASYVSILKRVGRCEHPTTPYTKKPVFGLDASISKNNIIKGNISILGKYHNIKMTFREFFYEDGKWMVSFNADNISCRSPLIGILANFMGVIYNKKTCASPKGSYAFELDYNIIDHLWNTRKEYGRMMRIIEVRAKAWTELCIELETVVRPMKA